MSADTDLWAVFARGVLRHSEIAACTTTNLETLWAWGNAETAPYPLMRWCNPMNTTEPWPGARDSGAQPGAHDVKIYASVANGIEATVYTLAREPYYPAILANLRAGVPRQQWGATSPAGSQLHAWGTGTAWLTSSPYFGPLPASIQGDFDSMSGALQMGPGSSRVPHELYVGMNAAGKKTVVHAYHDVTSGAPVQTQDYGRPGDLDPVEASCDFAWAQDGTFWFHASATTADGQVWWRENRNGALDPGWWPVPGQAAIITAQGPAGPTGPGGIPGKDGATGPAGPPGPTPKSATFPVTVTF